jgi:hypothetical protein
MEWTFPMVIHMEFGGFGLTEEIVRRLGERNCAWVGECQHSAGSNPRWYLPYRDGSDELRKDADLVAVVRELTEEYESRSKDLQSWRERTDLRQNMLNNLRVVDVRVVIEINDHDGKETVRVTGGTW